MLLAVTKKKGRKQIFHDQKCSLRMPMFDITNESSGAQKSSLKFNNNCNRKQICEESGCNLFEEQFANKDDDNSDLQDYEIDESVIHGACFSDDGLFDSDDSYGYVDSYSDEEDIFEQNLSSKIRRRAQHVIPEEYASLGSPSVECKHCHARMWKEERVNKNVTKGSPVFSVCCKKGDVKLPATPTPPTYLMDLYNDESADLNNLKDRDMISMKTYYSYRFQVRHNEAMTPRLGDIKKKAYFGKCIGVMYVVEFQKRGLPHNPKSPCMKGFKCIRHFPKKYSALNCKVTDLRHLWDSHWKHMVDDILMKRRNVMRNSKLMLNDKQLQFYALAEIDELLRSIGKSLKNFLQLPQPPTSYLNHGSNNLILEETNYNVVEMEAQ
ncbi:hypothetical protein POM88_053689 [Heracleum sosnowskyi]|uniref:Uncharacterized protein n=1 Tax=Heracleum sosnowskyi TaxID=360622 RepID=A0AAD8LVE6_9APIA|nr:hypothetical protein POM88_053689 [Heracleum sosnowskyi]